MEFGRKFLTKTRCCQWLWLFKIRWTDWSLFFISDGEISIFAKSTAEQWVKYFLIIPS